MIESHSSFKPKLPWTSLVLLLLTYITFGWVLYGLTTNPLNWLLVAFVSTLLAGFVTYPSQSISWGFGGFFKTDTRAFILIVISSILSVLLLTSLRFFVDAVVLCSAGLLASLDLKTGGWNKSISLFIILGWQLLGLSIGLAGRYISLHPIDNLPEYIYVSFWLRLLNSF